MTSMKSILQTTSNSRHIYKGSYCPAGKLTRKDNRRMTFEKQIDKTFAGEGKCCGKRRRPDFLDLALRDEGTSRNADDDEAGGAGTPTPEKSLPVGMSAIGEEVTKRMTYSSHGLISLMGRRRVMKDAVAVDMLGGEYAFYAVHNGHGGCRVANACRSRLHQLLENEVERWKSPATGCGACGGIEWEKAMVACFAKMNEEVNSVGNGAIDVKLMGTEAAVVMVGREDVVVANCGDSRAVLCRGRVAVPLSRDHKPDRTDERGRVEAAGGRVINCNDSRVLGVLVTSSIGDQYLKPYVISEPDVTVSKRTSSDDFLIIASDGLWDVVSNEVACEFVKRCLGGRVKKRFSDSSCAAEAAVILAGLAMSKGSKDNISAIVVELKKSSGIIS